MTNDSTSMPNTSVLDAAFLRGRDSAPAYWQRGILWIMLATAEDTGGAFTLMEQLTAKGRQAPRHLHEWMREGFYLLEGRFLNWYTPGGFEKIIIGAGVPATTRTLPPADLSEPDAVLADRLAAEIGLRSPVEGE